MGQINGIRALREELRGTNTKPDIQPKYNESYKALDLVDLYREPGISSNELKRM